MRCFVVLVRYCGEWYGPVRICGEILVLVVLCCLKKSEVLITARGATNLANGEIQVSPCRYVFKTGNTLKLPAGITAQLANSLISSAGSAL